jgi:hypothetical protein
MFARRGRPTPPLIHGTSAYPGGVLIEWYTNFLRFGRGIVVRNWPKAADFGCAASRRLSELHRTVLPTSRDGGP